jgi:hypothetical protein
MTYAHSHMTAPVMKLNVFISLDKPRKCDLFTPEKFQRDTNSKIQLQNNLQINFPETSGPLGSFQDSNVILAAHILWHKARGDPQHNF